VRVALVTTWGVACGIAEHAAYLKEAVEAADPTILIAVVTDLHPQGVHALTHPVDLIWLNYQAALHSQWTPAAIAAWQQVGIPVGVTYHDTGVPNSAQCLGILDAADAAVIHETPGDVALDGKVHYWRMGVPAWTGAAPYDQRWTNNRPILGTVGFPFPWKNYDELARVTREVGWALLLIAPGATAADQMRWEALNPHCLIVRDFTPRAMVVAMLGGCDASAFCYTCANTGQSGAILQGIAARKPVFAFQHCRQFRALAADPLAYKYIRWCTDFAQLQQRLSNLVPARVDCGMVALAEQDSWTRLGAQYAQLWRSLERAK
jgi:hypothetical protein